MSERSDCEAMKASNKSDVCLCETCQAGVGVDLPGYNLRISLCHINEGYWGDYDCNDPVDAPLMRVDVVTLNDGEPIQDASFCTSIRVGTSASDQVRFISWIVAEIERLMLTHGPDAKAVHCAANAVEYYACRTVML